MASYKNMRRYNAEKAAWISERLIELRKTIKTSELGQRSHNNLVIGSWNIRAFDEGEPRRDESYHYIAEIIDHFDVCTVQEVKKDLDPLKRLVKLLGPNWSYFVTDVTEGSKGNRERQAFLYNKNRVRFRNLVGEITLGNDHLIDGEQISRTPFFASFQAGWFRFTLCSVHIVFGDDKSKRTAEISALAKRLVKRAKDEDEVYVMIGDMNIEKRDDSIFKGLSDNGLTVPDFGPTNLKGNRYFDQIAFTSDQQKTKFVRSGTVDWRNNVYGQSDKDFYEHIAKTKRVEKGKNPYKNWNTSYQKDYASFEMSDHLPIWVELETDFSDDYLGQFIDIA